MASLKDLPRIVKNLLEQEIILQEGAKAIERSIPKRTRLGKGVKENLGETHKLPQLTKRTVDIRTKLKKEGRLTGPGATPKKSGFNRSGDTLNDIEVTVSKKEIKVQLAEKDRFKLEDNLRRNDNYQFMRLSAAEFKRVLNAITKSVDRAIKKVRFTKL